MKSSQAQKKWKTIVKNNTVHTKGGEYLSMEGVRSLEKLFIAKVQDLHEHPELITQDLEKWMEMTKGVVEALLIVTEVMEKAKDAIREKTIAEYEHELHK